MADLIFSDFKKGEFCKVFFYVLDSVNDDGSWGGMDFVDWKPCSTALALELLLSCGLHPEYSWFVHKNNEPIRHNLKDSLSYLDDNIQEDGSFGEDFWDACRLGIVLNKYNIFDRLKKYDKLNQYIIDSIKSNQLYRDTDSTWSGPGFYAIAIDYLDIIKKEPALSASILNELIPLQVSDDGSFRGSTGRDGIEFIHPIWHTSQVLKTMIQHQISPKDKKIIDILDWIKSSQDPNSGCFRSLSRYSVYYTAYAILGLSMLPSPSQETLDKSIKWIIDNISNSGRVIDTGGTIMAALALRSVEEKDLSFKVSITDLRKIDTLEDQNKILMLENKNLKETSKVNEKKIQSYIDKYKNADIVLSKKEVFIIYISTAIILAIFTILFTIR